MVEVQVQDIQGVAIVVMLMVAFFCFWIGLRIAQRERESVQCPHEKCRHFHMKCSTCSRQFRDDKFEEVLDEVNSSVQEG